MTSLSPLPRSLDPLPGESLPGYVLRLAHRLGLAPARILQLTGLAAGPQASRSLMMHLDAAAAGSFARATRLTAAEIAGLCMNSMSARYPQAAPVITIGRRGTWPVTSPWVFTTATRYCPQCLTGDSSPIQRQHGGAWRKTWRLPVVFACPLHHRLLRHLCPSCGQPAMPAASLIPHSTRSGLHPAQCRAIPRPERGARARLCQARLDSPAAATGGEDSEILDDLLALQAQLLALLQPDGPATIISVGRPAAAAQYFADLRLVCSLISGAWPASRRLIPAPSLAAAADHYITRLSSVNPRPYRLCDTPPLDPLPGAALIAAAARILDGDDLRVIGEFVTPARDGAPRKSPRGRWIRRYQRAGHDCSDGFQDAIEPLLHTFQRTDRRSRGRRAPARQISFAPEHIPEHLQDDWHYEHFRHIGGNTRLLRRAAALRLVQMSAGGSLAEAAAFLGIDHRYIAASPGSAAFADGPAEFRLAVHALARQLSAAPDLINYKHRRDSLRTWCIDPGTWQDIISQLPLTKGPFQPELSDCKRQFASEVIWARVTQGEHLLAPRTIENQLSAGDPTWHRRRDNMWHFYLATPPKPHYATLRKILSAYADNLAAVIDHQPQSGRKAILTPGDCQTASLSWHRQPGHLYLRKGITMDPFNDWSDCGLATVRAVLAEAITAEFAHSQDPDATWHGGQQRGYDVTSKDGKRDAKCVRIDEDGYIVLARRNAEPFDPERVDRLMLLRLSASTRYRVNLASGTAELAASASILDAWDVPVAALNRVLPEHGDDDPTWRNVLLDPADLAEYKVG